MAGPQDVVAKVEDALAANELFQRNGYLTLLTKTPGTVLDEGFSHSLGHGRFQQFDHGGRVAGVPVE